MLILFGLNIVLILQRNNPQEKPCNHEHSLPLEISMVFDSYYLFYDSPANSSQSVGGWLVWHRQAGMGGSRVGFYF